MLYPEQLGDFETRSSLQPTLAPIFSREVGPRFLARDLANARAWKNKEPQTELSIEGRRYYQKTFKYPARSLDILMDKFSQVSSDEELIGFLCSTNCHQLLTVGENSNEAGATMEAGA